MPRDPVEVVRGLFSEQRTDWPGEAFDLISYDVVISPSSGEVYVGHEGYAQWYEAYIQRYERASFDGGVYEDLGGGWVLAAGAASSHRRDGHEERQPGFWLARVRGDRISAVLYYRTRDGALAALKK